MQPPLSLADASAQIGRGRLKPIELVERCLEQIDKHDERLRAWVVVDRHRARRTAEALGKQPPRGPLYGIPLGIKDIIDVEGFATRAGSPLGEGRPAAADAPLVAALRRAGAVILGKTVTVEFACFDPSPTFNPWNPAHTPGGSSSGSAVAVAVGMCLGALGTQTGGSLVRPASYCGIAACKPTFGTLSTDGIVPVSHHFDHPGPMARRVADLQILLAAMDERFAEPAVEPSAPPRLGLLEPFFLDQADAAIRRATEDALDRLSGAGATVEPLAVPDGVDFDGVRAVHRRIMAVEAAAYHRRQFAEHRAAYGPLIAALLDEGLATAGVDFADALAWQRDFRRRIDAMLRGVDALVVPSTDTTAPATRTTTGTPKFQAPWSCAGVPVVSIPCGLAPDGLPAGVQLVGRRGSDAALLRTAAWCERAIAFDRLPPGAG